MKSIIKTIQRALSKRCQPLALVIVLSLILGCTSVFIESSPGADIKLLSSDKPVNFQQQFKCWYLFWGLVPMSNNVTADVLKTYQFKDVRIRTYFSALDFFVAFFTEGIVVSHSVYIEGNAAK
jgi:hypothetical protein